jgi:diacylglycerol O-acyltransferase
VERLSGLDASFVYNETSSLHMHTIKYAVLDVSEVDGGFSSDKLRHELARRLHLLPPFRRRLVEVPLGLHHPVWIEDPDFDLDAHVRRVGVPGPGGRREMDELVAEISSWQLDRRRPLWECWILEGLADDLDDPAGSPPSGRRVGFLVKMHHALADGVAAAALLANVFELEAHSVDPPPPTHPWRPERPPSACRLMYDALRDARLNLRLLSSLLGRTFTGLRAVSQHRREAEVTPPRPIMDVPRTPFNGALTPHRRFATADLRFEDIRAVRAANPGITVNDVILGLVAESLRRHLGETDRLPTKALVAGVPVSSDAAGDVRLYGNKVSNLFTSLRTDVADPVERLTAIHDVTAAAKRFHTLLGTDMLADWSEMFPPKPYAWFMRQYSRLALANRHNPPINLVVSNVPGPRDPLYIAGAELAAFYSVGPIVEGVGLNITVWSYQDAVHVAAIGCREHWTDLHVVTDGMVAALEELVERSKSDAVDAQAGA